MKANEAKRLKELERENATLKRIVADKELEVVTLKGIARGRKVKSSWSPALRFAVGVGRSSRRRRVRRRLGVLGEFAVDRPALSSVDGVAAVVSVGARVAGLELDRADLLGQRSWKGVGASCSRTSRRQDSLAIS